MVGGPGRVRGGGGRGEGGGEGNGEVREVEWNGWGL